MFKTDVDYQNYFFFRKIQYARIIRDIHGLCKLKTFPHTRLFGIHDYSGLKSRQTLVFSLQYISLKRYKHFLCLCQSCKTKILTVKFGVYFFAVVVVFGNMLAFFYCAFAVFCSIILSFSMGKEVLLGRVSTTVEAE